MAGEEHPPLQRRRQQVPHLLDDRRRRLQGGPAGRPVAQGAASVLWAVDLPDDGPHTSRAGQQRGSAMGAHYRHTTPEMAARVVAAIQQRLTIALGVAELAVERQPNRSTLRVF